MEIVLKEDVENLGEAGDVVDVADGYARNYLFPKQLAMKATDQKIKEIERQKEKERKKEEERRENAEEIAENLQQEEFSFSVKAGEKGKLFGSITSNDIVEQIQKKGYEDIESNDVVLDENIKSLGVHKVNVNIYDDVSATIDVEVVEANQGDD